MELATEEALLQAPDRALGSDHISDSEEGRGWSTGAPKNRPGGRRENAKGGVKGAATGRGVGGPCEHRCRCLPHHGESFSAIELDSKRGREKVLEVLERGFRKFLLAVRRGLDKFGEFSELDAQLPRASCVIYSCKGVGLARGPVARSNPNLLIRFNLFLKIYRPN